MRTFIVVSLAGLAAVLIAATPGRMDSPRNQEPEEISRLHESIRLRFQDRKAFGMLRILPNQFHGVRTFQPENATEQAVVGRLQQKGYEVALYLVGRKALESPALDPRRHMVQGPAFITPGKEYPQADTLLADGRAALISLLEKGDGYSLQTSGWTVAMRPLRATNQTCVECHGGLKTGDALGVAMYAYRVTSTWPLQSNRP